MWTKEHRDTYKRDNDRYPSDLTDEEWARLKPLIPPPKPGRRPFRRHPGPRLCGSGAGQNQGPFPWLELVWADGGHNARQVKDAVVKVPVLRMEIVKRTDDMKGFVILPRRLVVERTFS